ncbi:Uncharacterized protein SCF082_LOCUS1723, partial [Durusdinium trenchii]
MAATTKSGHTSKSAQTSKSAATARSARSGAGPAGPGARYMVRSRARTSTIDAMQMHEAVTPDRWCVTKMDLRHLRLEVLRWLQDGEIQSNPDTEDSDDEDKYGPSIYSVNEQYIKPVTADAGKMSWALMMNPEGLDCDLFVSHAWQEGIFEFLSKVLGSWPFWVRHAWCCMLANPQHLNIGSMLQSPKTSPFALALEASRLVLVVSNRRKSVYCRLWCGYEAYVASEKSKVIQIAKPLQIRSMCWTFGLALLPLAGGLIFGGLGRWQNWDLRLGVIFIALALLASANTHHVMRQASNYMGLAVSACLAVSWIPLPTVRFIWVLPPAVRVIYNVLLWLCVLAFFLLAEVDRARSEDIACEGQKLRKGYRGSICQASCSEAADKRRIWDEIGNNVHQVDHAINVLISAGLSSPALRACAEKGVEIEGAGHAESAIPLVFLGPQLLVGLSQVIIIYLNGQNTADPGLVLEALAVVARIAFIILICKSAPDERCFMFKVIT